jgi:hypothetical protein
VRAQEGEGVAPGEGRAGVAGVSVGAAASRQRVVFENTGVGCVCGSPA